MSEVKNKKTDARSIRSQEALRQALLNLIEDKSFDQITIRDITGEAGVSYPVFFRQFEDKEELLADIATDEIRDLLSTPLDQGCEKSAQAICALVEKHRALWKVLLTAGARDVMRSEFLRVAREIAESPRKRSNPWAPVDLASSIIVTGLFEVLAWWLAQPENYPIENVVILIKTLVLEPLLIPKDIKLKKFK